MDQQASPAVPTPATITPALLKTHSITDDEYALIVEKLGRTPSLTELGIFSVMWSEHCSYKSSRVHLKRLPTKGTRLTGPGSVVQGPGENAGIIDVGDGWACAFKIESHNHPSYIEPYQGAATGVGGILRDIFTMGARPMAVMDSLRFGPLAPPDTKPGHPEPSPQGEVEGSRETPLTTEAQTLSATIPPASYPLSSRSEAEGSASPEPPPATTAPDYARNRQTMTGVVHGVGGYGNCFGVPNLGGETRFEPCYSGNPLLNAFALGLVRTDEIFYAKAEGVGNPVFYVGAKTGRDGIHGATMASEEFTEGSEQKRPNVQMGDPFLEKLLLEACLEVMKTGAVLGIQDMGAAGLTCSTCEMGARGHLGVTIELDRVPQRETGMSTYEIMLSESQERMLLVAEKGREQEVLDVFAKWGLDCAEVGTVTADDVMRVYHAGVLEAEIPNPALTDEAPVYHRPVGTWTPPVPKDPPAWVLEELKKPRDYTADLKKLLASPNICSKHWIYEQYDSMVQTNTVQGPGGEAGVIRIKGTGQSATSFLSSHSTSLLSSSNTPFLSSRSEAEGSASPADPGQTTSTTEPFLGAAALAAPAEGLSLHAVEHSILGKIANFIAGSTPEAEATLLTGNEDAANPVVSSTHTPASAAAPPASGSATHLPSSNTPFLSSRSTAFLSSRSEAEGSASSPDTIAKDGGSSPPSAPKPERGIAMALAGNGRWCYLDPKLGAMHAVAEAARKVACTGATPVAATNCLNFGNPQKPEIMAQLSLAIDGIAEACTALNTPITGGNVSLYNETQGEAIYPTPVIGVVGLLDDVTKAIPSSFQNVGDALLLLYPTGSLTTHFYRAEEAEAVWLEELGSSEYAHVTFGTTWGKPPAIDLEAEAQVFKTLEALASQRLLTSACDEGSGGIAVAVAKAGVANNLGASFGVIDEQPGPLDHVALFRESLGNVVATCAPENIAAVEELCKRNNVGCHQIGQVTAQIFESHDIGLSEPPLVWSLDDLRPAYTNALANQLSEEVST